MQLDFERQREFLAQWMQKKAENNFINKNIHRKGENKKRNLEPSQPLEAAKTREHLVLFDFDRQRALFEAVPEQIGCAPHRIHVN